MRVVSQNNLEGPMEGRPATRRPRVVLCHGVFDVLHLGHVRYLQAAAMLGTKLVVSVTSDEHAAKAPGRPVHTQAERMAMLAALDCVDAVLPSNEPTAAEVIALVRPAVYAKGIEYRAGGLHPLEHAAVAAVGAQLQFIDTPTKSSSAIINRSFESPEVAEYLERARKLGFAEIVPDLIERMSALSVCFVGETIVDEYVFVEPLGKPSKEFIVCGNEVSREKYNGGVMAAMEHARGFVRSTHCRTGHALRKTRWVEVGSNRKLFETYCHEACPVADDEIGFMDAFDVTVATDFGHGFITSDDRMRLRMTSKFLAVNTQTNAGNHGFNLITKYPQADYACIDLPEARLAVGDASMDAAACAAVLTNRMAIGRMTVTHGRNGSVTIDKRGPHHPNPIRVPALAGKVVDTMGAGDAYLAITAPLMSIAKPDEVEAVAFIGNVAGAIKVGILGHRSAIDKDTLLKYCATLLK